MKQNTFDSCNIMVVDDHEVNQMIMGAVLERDYAITANFANNGEEAVALTRENKYDLIFMDINMPVMNGIEAARIIMRQYPDTYIVALTTNTSQESRKQCSDVGMSDYITKPIDLLALEKAIRGCFGRN